MTGGTAAQDWREWARELGLWDGPPEWWRPMHGSWGDVVADLAGAEVCGERVAAGAVWAQIEGVGRAGPVTVTVRVAVCWGSLAPAGERRWGWCRVVRRRPWPGAGGWSAEGQAKAAEELIEEILWGAP